jgi:hypothetical protein
VQNSPNQSVTWAVNGVPGGNTQVGYIDSQGMYSAPSAVPNPATVSVQAASVAVPAAIGSASVTITSPVPVSVTVSPATATVRVRRSKQFTAAVQNTTDTRVTWQVNGITGGNSTVGTISMSGQYTAPNAVPQPRTVTVRAISLADPSKSGSASVTVRW